MKKIAFIIQSWYLGGTETGIYNIANYLKEKYPSDFRFHFIATDNKTIHPKFSKIGDAVYMGRDWRKITEYLKMNEIDILQWGNVSEYAKCGFDAGVGKIIERIAGPRSLGKDHSYNDLIISSSEGIVPAIRKEWSGEIAVIKNGVHLDNDITQDRLKFKNDDFIVVYPAARMGEGQNYQMLISAVIKARKENPKIKLVLMGDHPEHSAAANIKGKLIAVAKPIGKDCVFTGFLNDPDPIISGADLCVVPAKSHGISNALISAAGYGIPVISTMVGQNSEICIDGINGYMVRINNVDVLSEYILKLSLNAELRNSFGAAGKKIVDHNFNLTTQADVYGRLYLSGLGSY